MSFEVKDTAPVEENDRVLVTGVANLKVVALNPNKAELEALGRKPKEEPKYLYPNSKTGNMQCQVDIWLEGEVEVLDDTELSHVLTKTTFWVEDSTSRNVYIDKFGGFGKNKEKLDATARLAYNGEVDLIQFLKALSNLGKKDPASLSKVAALASQGDLTEVQGIITRAQKNRVQVLLGVRDGKYQDVFSKVYDFADRTNNAYLHKKVVEQIAYERNGGGSPKLFLGPINFLNDLYVPSAYAARKYTAEDQEAFEKSMPRGTFGANGPGGGGPAGNAFSAAPQPSGMNGGSFGPRAIGAPIPQMRPQPAPVPISSDADDDLPF
ncbi:hypothetical protein [Hymenobacter siberiensis]|uniref:hypothetical protein n=1 Tax=Hymenobacter siberiensis TaxID=2848396 RepID=UPI001C1DDE81|nr:hypothetical protein [Hymenobacter siberiensis]